MKSGIYKIVNNKTGKLYVGSAINIKNRWRLHKHYLQNQKGSPKLQNAWNKYGEDSFEFIIIEEVENNNLLIREQYWLDKLNSVVDGYNINPIAGSSLGRKASAETIDKLRKSHLGKKLTEEQRQKIIKRLIGRPVSKETREKLRASNLGKPHGKMSEEQKKLISNTCKAKGIGKWMSGRKRPIEYINKAKETYRRNKELKEQVNNLNIYLPEEHEIENMNIL